ncbi:MAG: response regulator [Bacteroidetes bacterium]|nr:response regulator [Bacteroidota bacterium]
MKTLTLYQASKYCGVSPHAVSDWIDAGELNALRIGGVHRRVRREDLEEFLKRRGMPIASDVVEGVPKRILVVEDDALIIETIVRSLEEEPYDYEIVSAADGVEAGSEVNRFSPDLLILDIMMPNIDGHEVCRKVKQDPATSHMKVMVLSAYMNEENYERMKEAGADVCFSKPLPLEMLKKEVGRLLGVE